MNALPNELDGLPVAITDKLRNLSFDRQLLIRLASEIGQDPDKRNRLGGDVAPPAPDDLQTLPEPGSEHAQRLEKLGLEALRRGELAVIVLAGGMATRMGGVVKALVPALDNHTFLDLRLAENRHFSQVASTPIPLWLMTSWATDGKLREALGAVLDGTRYATFVQNISLRLTEQGGLFYEANGEPSLYAPGHGDVPEALRRSGLLKSFIQRGGKYVSIANIDNLGATIDPLVLGAHIDHGAPVSVEVVDKVGSDRGGIPVRYKNRRMILEEFRLPRSFDPTTVRVFNTNTFLVNAEALDGLDMEFTWVHVVKKVGDRKAVQFERLIGEITAELDTRFLRVPRDGSRSRFLPVKDMDELARRRDEIEAVARARGMLSP